MIMRLFLYPFTLLICFLPCALATVLGAINPGYEDGVIMVCSATSPLIGFINAIIYGFTYAVRYSLSKVCCGAPSEIELETSEEINPYSLTFK